MDPSKKELFRLRVQQEPYARMLGLKLIEVNEGYALIEMKVVDGFENIFGMTHGGAIFSLMDEAFQIACNSHGTLAVALNIDVSYMRPPETGSVLRAEAQEIHLTQKTGHYDIRVTDEQGRLIAACRALAYRKGSTLPFLEHS